MSIHLSLDDDEIQQLDRIADQIADGNRTKAVQRMIKMVQLSADVAANADEIEDEYAEPEVSDDLDLEDITSLEDARKAISDDMSTTEKTDVLEAYLSTIQPDFRKSKLREEIQQVLDCHRTTANDYIKRLEARGTIQKTPVELVDLEDVEDEYQEATSYDRNPTLESRLDQADDVSDLIRGLSSGDYGRITPEAAWRRFWKTIENSEGENRLTVALVRAANNVAEQQSEAVTFLDYKESQ